MINKVKEEKGKFWQKEIVERIVYSGENEEENLKEF